MEVGQVDDGLVDGLGRVDHLDVLGQLPLAPGHPRVVVQVGLGLTPRVNRPRQQEDEEAADLQVVLFVVEESLEGPQDRVVGAHQLSDVAGHRGDVVVQQGLK